MCPEEYAATIKAFIRSNGFAPFPTACALAIQGAVAAADRVAVAPAADRCRRPVILDLQGPGWIG